ncbi:MAG: hypothetical protein QNJ17_05900 [Desulfocapsaceae bacterium]|nr:hypothetical protein [Desulfocapsaceae bacterium]
MAEIRSTLDMVMERAAKIAAEADDKLDEESSTHQGMRLAAEYLRNGDSDLQTILQAQKKEEQPAILKGMVDTLLRNIVLPRDEMLLENSGKALRAVSSLATPEISSTCAELEQLLNQYSQHKDQMVQQLEDAIRQQLEQHLAQQGAKLSDDVAINPAMHPKYQEELDKMLTDLNGQYNEALDQRKNLIKQNLVMVR